MKVLYAFIDESGNLDFSGNQGSTEWYTLTSICTQDPMPGIAAYFKLRHDQMCDGIDIPCFHATEDKQAIRDQVFQCIAGLPDLRVDCIAVRKRRLYPRYRRLDEFYPMVLGWLLTYVFHPYGMNAKAFDRIAIVLSKFQAPQKVRGAMISGVKRFLHNNLAGVTPYALVFHPANSHPYLQFVDYCSWALYVARERAEPRPKQSIGRLVRSDFDVFASGYKDWY